MTNLTLITGSTLGGAEYVGDHLAELLQNQGIDVSVINEATLDDVVNASRLLLITSTHGAGDYPENLAPLMEALAEQKPTLNHLIFAVIAIGDSSYDTFCGAGIGAEKAAFSTWRCVCCATTRHRCARKSTAGGSRGGMVIPTQNGDL